MSGGSNSRTRQRGAGGSSGGDSQTTGSATVRIMRPPVEAGAAPKLEKTPTLTNDSIVELVEAGFSEGTIVRRIEQSPADFDLTPAKLAELRRHRVSDRVIAAMTAAMGDDSSQGTKPSSNTPEK
jgi:siroheme synthase